MQSISLATLLKTENILDTKDVLYELDKGKSTSVFGMNFASKLHFAAYNPYFVLYVAPDAIQARKIYDSLVRCGTPVGLFFEREDVLLYSRAYSQESSFKRIKVLERLLNDELRVLVTTPSGLMGYVPLKEHFARNRIVLSKGENEFYPLLGRLAEIGYRRVEKVEKQGEYAVRGDILDIFPVNLDEPVRAEFFGDEIESIRRFDVESMKGGESVESVTIPPASEILFDSSIVRDAVKKINKNMSGLDANAALRKAEIVEDITMRTEAGEKDIPWLIPYFRQAMTSIFSWLPEDSLTIYDEVKQVNETTSRLYDEHFGRCKSLIRVGEVTTEHAFAVIGRERIFGGKLNLAFQQITTQNPIFNPEAVISVKNSAFTKYYLDRPSLYVDIRNWIINGYKIVLSVGDPANVTSLCSELTSQDIPATKSLSLQNTVSVTDEYFPASVIFHRQKLVLIGVNDLVRQKAQVVKSRKKDVFTQLNAGDYAVHEVHGIGLCKGVVKLKGEGEKDFVEVEYKDGTLFVPVEQINLLQRYSGSEKAPSLSRIGGKEFAKVKERVKASISAMAVDLISLYKARESLRGFVYPKDDALMQDFEAAFPFKETEDQLAAIVEIKRDMERGRLMDRLLCGDVGYGKTEVAMRAVFKAVEGGKQAALLAPTTILSEQHFNTMRMRFEGFPVNVAVVNRFRKPAEIKSVLERLANGEIDVICGTHRLLSSDVRFKDLGLLVLDEEQRFGVSDKEKIKDMKKDINVLTMSATPIPRTLHMSLSGIRDISVLETPPENRLPVQTFVTEYNENIVTDCVAREKGRGGQCFILYNRVESIDSFAGHLAELMPDVRFTVCHGQMDEAVLESRMAEFYNGESDVLVSTTIIENGIDLPSANTLIVCDADMLGLSQLYQLRGRVGRSDRLAYAYFTYREGKVLTENAYKRLSAIMDYTELGSGFKIAMRDLEIRGAGNVLGREQHGHLEKVGYDMYCKLLDEVIGEMDGKQKTERTESEIKTDLNANIPEGYLEEKERMKLYRRIADLKDRDMIAKLTDELKEICGNVPVETVNLMKISYVRNLACDAGVSKVVCTRKGSGVQFPSSDAFKNKAVLFATASAQGRLIIAESKHAVVLKDSDKSTETQLEVIAKFLEDVVAFDPSAI